MIKERVDKDYNSILRTALTSISKVNKTDVETLRTSFGVCLQKTFFSTYYANLGTRRASPTSPKLLQINFETFLDLVKSKLETLRTRLTSLYETMQHEQSFPSSNHKILQVVQRSLQTLWRYQILRRPFRQKEKKKTCGLQGSPVPCGTSNLMTVFLQKMELLLSLRPNLLI